MLNEQLMFKAAAFRRRRGLACRGTPDPCRAVWGATAPCEISNSSIQVLFEVAPGVNSGFQPFSIQNLHNAEDIKDTEAHCGTRPVLAGTGLNTPAHGRVPSSSDMHPTTTRLLNDSTEAIPQLREAGAKIDPGRREKGRRNTTSGQSHR